LILASGGSGDAATTRYFGKMMSEKGIATVVVPHFVK
jgi:hypothetical protein